MSQGFEIIEFNCPFCGKKLKFKIKKPNLESKVIECDCDATLVILNFNNQELKRNSLQIYQMYLRYTQME